MSDDEMRNLDIPLLQDEGIIFLWVTGRAMELGRECLSLWGYERCEEIIWVKTNQLQRIIRTGRTGHWINHGKEHCLVGIKGNPPEINRGLDCDVIVAEVRATSHKPDEIYGIIERLAPGTQKNRVIRSTTQHTTKLGHFRQPIGWRPTHWTPTREGLQKQISWRSGTALKWSSRSEKIKLTDFTLDFINKLWSQIESDIRSYETINSIFISISDLKLVYNSFNRNLKIEFRKEFKNHLEVYLGSVDNYWILPNVDWLTFDCISSFTLFFS